MNSVSPRKQVRAKGIEKRQRILDATAKLIAQQGTTNITLHDVGNEVGMYAANIYYYFKSRDDLIKEVHVAALAWFRQKVADAVASQPVGSSRLDLLRQAIRVTIEMNSATDDYALAYTRVLDRVVASSDPDIRQSRKAIRDLWLTLIRDAQASGELSPFVDVNLLRFFLVGSMHWVSYWYRPGGPSTPTEIADAFFDFLINGAGNPDARR